MPIDGNLIPIIFQDSIPLSVMHLSSKRVRGMISTGIYYPFNSVFESVTMKTKGKIVKKLSKMTGSLVGDFYNGHARRHAGIITRIAGIIVMMQWLTVQASGQDYQSNSSFIESVADSLFEKLFDRAPLSKDQQLVLKEVEGDHGWFIENRFLAFLMKKGFAPNYGKSSDTAEQVVGQLHLLDIGVDFEKNDNKTFDRVARIKIAGKFYNNKTGNVIWAGDISQINRDVIPEYIVADNSDEYQFVNRPSSFHDGSWKRYIEPIVITGSTGIVVYLFFRIRSSS